MVAKTNDFIPHWTVSPSGTASWILDSKKPRSGKSSLRLSAKKSGFAQLISDIPLQNNRALRFTVWLRSERAKSPVQLSFEATVDGRPYQHAHQILVDTHWRQFQLSVTDIPTRAIERPVVAVRVSGKTNVWIDDVDLRLERTTSEDLRQLTKIYSAIFIAWQGKRYADCQRLLESYWGQFAFDQPLMPPAPLKEVLRPAKRKRRFLIR